MDHLKHTFSGAFAWARKLWVLLVTGYRGGNATTLYKELEAVDDYTKQELVAQITLLGRPKLMDISDPLNYVAVVDHAPPSMEELRRRLEEAQFRGGTGDRLTVRSPRTVRPCPLLCAPVRCSAPPSVV